MTWKIELTSGAVVFTETPMDFDRMGRERWVCIEAIPKNAHGGLLRDLPTARIWLNIAQIVSIKDVDA